MSTDYGQEKKQRYPHDLELEIISKLERRKTHRHHQIEWEREREKERENYNMEHWARNGLKTAEPFILILPNQFCKKGDNSII